MTRCRLEPPLWLYRCLPPLPGSFPPGERRALNLWRRCARNRNRGRTDEITVSVPDEREWVRKGLEQDQNVAARTSLGPPCRLRLFQCLNERGTHAAQLTCNSLGNLPDG